MDQRQDVSGSRHQFTADELEAIGDYLPDVRRSLTNQNIVRTYLAIAFVVGLIAQVVGYVLKPSAGAEPFGLAVDLLYALGWSLWTGVVVTYFLQVLPESKRRQIVEALDAYDAARKAKITESGNQPPV